MGFLGYCNGLSRYRGSLMCPLTTSGPNSLIFVRASVAYKQNSTADVRGLGAANDGLGTTIKYLRQTTSGAAAAGNGLGATIKCLRQTASGTAGCGLGITIKYLRQTTNGIAGNGPVTKKTQGFVGFLRPRLLVLLSHAPCQCSLCLGLRSLGVSPLST